MKYFHFSPLTLTLTLLAVLSPAASPRLKHHSSDLFPGGATVRAARAPLIHIDRAEWWLVVVREETDTTPG